MYDVVDVPSLELQWLIYLKKPPSPTRILFGAAGLILSAYYRRTYAVNDDQRYPKPVADLLRRAWWYVNVKPDPAQAVRTYGEALAKASQMGMDPVSDEVSGIRILLATFLESIGQRRKAIDALEHLRRDCLARSTIVDRRSPERDKVLSNTVRVTVKLGQLYQCRDTQDLALAQTRLEWAVTTVLKEELRRKQKDEDDSPVENTMWLSPDEMGAAFEGEHCHPRAPLPYLLRCPF